MGVYFFRRLTGQFLNALLVEIEDNLPGLIVGIGWKKLECLKKTKENKPVLQN